MKFLLLSLLAYIGYSGTCNFKIAVVDTSTGRNVSLGNARTDRFCGGITKINSPLNRGACFAIGKGFTVADSNFPVNRWTKGATVGSRIHGCTTKRLCNLQFKKNATENFRLRCRKAVFNQVIWQPKSKAAFCNLTQSDLNATRSDINAAVYYAKVNVAAGYGCCATGNDCNERIDFRNDTQCPNITPLQQFYNRANVCWNRFRGKVLHHRWCEADGEKRRQRESLAQCFTNRRWDYTKCSNKATYPRKSFGCSKALRRLLTQFGNCACAGAVNAGYAKFGASLAGVFEDNWNKFCPDIDLRCNDNSTSRNYGKLVSKLRKIRKFRWRFTLGKRFSLFSEALKNKIRNAIAKYFERLTEDVEIRDVINNRTNTSRRLLETSTLTEVSFVAQDDSMIPKGDAKAITDINKELTGEERIVASQPECVTTGEGNIDMNGDVIQPNDNCYVTTTSTTSSTTSQQPGATPSQGYAFRLIATAVVAFVFAVSLV